MPVVRVLGSGDGGAMRARDTVPEAPGAGWVWIDLRDPSPEEVGAAARAAGIDPAALDVRADAYPSARVLDEGVIVVTRSLSSAGERVATTPLILIATPAALVSIRVQDLPGVEFVAGAAATDPGVGSGGPGPLLARLVDVGAERFVPLTDALDGSIERLEDDAIEAHPDVLQEAHALRRDAAVMRGVLRLQREMLRALVRSAPPVIGAEGRRRLEDAYDLHMRVVEALDAARLTLTGVIEVYRSAVAERTNEVMKVLTVFAVILLPLSLIAGIYGMNFEYMPELRQRWAYFGVLGLMAVIATGLWLYFARRGFIGGPRRARAVGRGLVSVAFLPIRTVTAVTRTVVERVRPGGEE